MEDSRPPGRGPSATSSEHRSRETSQAPRYPHVHVALYSRNPYAVISAVRHALRRSRIEAAEIVRFTEEAFEVEEPRHMHEVCGSWADVEFLAG